MTWSLPSEGGMFTIVAPGPECVRAPEPDGLLGVADCDGSTSQYWTFAVWAD